jgi:hypothetical protein
MQRFQLFFLGHISLALRDQRVLRLLLASSIHLYFLYQ